ncbi:MAG: Gfo/Idh/MocA family oxidoreductase [Aquificota bacterium]|nr:MAG: Gfo/Idh/MocA family oxidoreductase [Aquificota bacterium]
MNEYVLIVGLGNMGRKYLSKLEELGQKLVACDIDLQKATDKYPFYCHLGEVKEELKAVIVAIDPIAHVSVSENFLEKGIPVLLEKPPALSIKDFEKIYHYPNLYVSEVETFSSCLKFFPKKVENIQIERLGKGKGYISPLWDLAWHDLYLLQLFFEDIKIERLTVNKVWELHGRADDVPFSIRTAWQYPEPSRRWVINGGQVILDFAREEVRVGNKLIHREEKRDKLRLMLESFIKGDFDHKSRERAKKNLMLLEHTERLPATSF